MNLGKLLLMLGFAGALWAADQAIEGAKKQIAAKNFDAAISSLETAVKAKPKSPELKAALVEALLAKGNSVMADDALPPRAKYPAALRTFRQVLAYDKDNKSAQSNINTIEAIYKSMGRPIPQ